MDINKIKNFFRGRKDKEEVTEDNNSEELISESAVDSVEKKEEKEEENKKKRTSLSEEDKLILLCKELDIPPINIYKYKIPPEIIKMIPEELARTYKILPLAKSGTTLTLAMCDPFNIVAIDSIRDLTRLDIQLVLSTPSQIIRTIDDYYGTVNLEKELKEEEISIKEGIKLKSVSEEEKVNIREIAELSQRERIVELVNNILLEALRQRASDIHIEPYPDTLRIRYRIDGVLQEKKLEIVKEDEQALIARFKILSKLDITQRRLPQDGRISIKLEAKDIDVRVSILPLVTGEKIVMRILEKGGLQIDLESLGFSTYALERFEKAIAKPHGMILITGPTGSGKSTTLYAILSRLNTPDKNIITIEDPVEYQMKGITQIQVKPEIGLNFANVLRAVLRQNPDIVMVGEIRDGETADIAIKAALTGHLILSTLHTNDAPSAIVRLINMKIEPFLIASTVTLIAAQRLCRKICPKCKESYETSVEKIKGLPPNFKEKRVLLYRGKGCSYCNNTGYFGRVAIVEALLIDDTLRQMILEKKSLTIIRDYAIKEGMKTLREDAMDKCLRGEISLEEVLRVTPEG